MRTSLASPGLVARSSTLLFNFVQLGLAIKIATPGGAVGAEVVLLFAFELGILIDSLWRGGSLRTWSVILAVSGLALLASDHLPSGVIRICALSGSTCLLALALKKIRTASDAMGEVKKRWRALGYLLSGVFLTEIAAVAAVTIAVLVAVSSLAGASDKRLLSRFRLDARNLPAYAVIMLHHLHYFSYAYIVVFWLIEEFQLSRFLVGPAFYVGWAGYYLFLRVTRRQRLIVVGGHILASAAVVGLAFSTRIEPFLAFWLLTGVGGGTIVLLRDLVIGVDREVYERFKTWEAVGHILGLSVLVAATVAGNANLAFGVAALAGIACAFGVLTVRRPKGGGTRTAQ